MELALILGVWNKGLKNLSRGLYTFDDKPDYMPWKDTHPVRTNHHLTPCLLFTASEVISEMLPVFSSGSFTVCGLALSSLIHLELKFAQVRGGPSSSFPAWEWPVFSPVYIF